MADGRPGSPALFNPVKSDDFRLKLSVCRPSANADARENGGSITPLLAAGDIKKSSSSSSAALCGEYGAPDSMAANAKGLSTGAEASTVTEVRLRLASADAFPNIAAGVAPKAR